MDAHKGTFYPSEECSICLDVLTDPVSTPCGHNFCKTCLTQYWDNSQHCHCPFCKEKFTKRPELKTNTTLREVVDHVKKKNGLFKPEILCDVCTGVKQKALKSCLNCGATFCESHLELHTVGNLRKHKIIDPVENPQAYLCQKHERPLELFCRDDQVCVCLFCTEGDHKNHNTVPIDKESGERKTQLVKTQMEVQQMIQDRLKKIKDIKHSVELRKKAAEKQAEVLIKELEQEITKLKRRDTELEQLSHTEDHLHLLQVSDPLSAQ
uniref:Uncharacterized protein n=1 Tax=Pygocentrus nattereri TaxID=42514 RepID=A0A3B4CYN6_PYGNA